MSADVVVIGAGAVGTAIARELTRFELEVVLIDKNEDVGGDASKSNSAIIHTGYDAPPGTLESRLVTAANPMYDKLCEELDVPFRRTGAILAAVTGEQNELLNGIIQKAHKNNVDDVRMLSREQALALEPEISADLKGALLIPRESIIDPFLLVVALAENGAENGLRVMTATKALGIKTENGKVKGVLTNRGEIRTRFVINAAGLHGDEVAAMVGLSDFKVHPRKGQFYILDKNTPYKIERIILPVPTKLTKGKLASPTIHGNILIGPTAEDLSDKEDKAVTAQGLKEVVEGVRMLVPKVSARDAITQYCGLRPTRTPEGYFIEASGEVKGYVGVTGIRSTGLTASIAIASYVVDILDKAGLDMRPKKDFNPRRIGIKKFADLSWKERDALIRKNPRYGHVICRCENVTEGEIIEAICRPLGARSVDAVKRRLRAGMGRCQGGFCGPRVVEILARELGVPAFEITKRGQGSRILSGPNR